MTRVALALTLLLAAPAWGATRSARLSPDVVPARYAITLTPDLAHGTFSGSETIEVALAKPTAHITLNASGLTVGEARVVGDGAAQDAVVQTDDAQETLTLTVAHPLPAGTVQVVLGWTALLDDNLTGFYRVETEGRPYAFTHFEPANARRAFPCFDEPGFKVPVSLTAIVDANDDVVSNAPVAETTSLPDGRKRVQFAETAPLPSYLVALAVGRFAAMSRVVDGVTVRLLAPPEQLALGATALDDATALVPRLATYFATGYPYAKLDLVAVPELVPNGMENAGAIFLRADRMLVDRSSASPEELRLVERLVAHELAHQWLGDLTTPRWWDDLWLNEATATFVAAEVTGDMHPDRRPWLETQSSIEDTLTLDEQLDARPVHAPIANGHAARAVFDSITYFKCSAILHMLDAWLGPGTMREALAAYVAAHRYGVTDSADFFASLDAAAGRPVAAMARTWLERSGHPRVDVSARCQGGALVVTLHQSRDGAVAVDGGEPTPWPIPLALRWPSGERSLLFDTHSTIVEIAGCPAWIEANSDRLGFYRVRYDGPLAAALAAAAPRALDASERFALAADTWADVRTGATPLSGYLELFSRLGAEPSPAVLAELGRRLSFVGDELLPDAQRDLFARFVAAHLAPQYRVLGPERRVNDDDDTRLLRAQLLELLGRDADFPAAIAAATTAYTRYLNDPRAVDPALVPVVLRVVARHGDASRFDQLLGLLRNARAPVEQRRYVDALAAFARPNLLHRTLQLLLGGPVPPDDMFMLIDALMTQGRHNSALAWSFFRSHFDAIGERAPRLDWLVGPAALLCSERSEHEVEGFFSEQSHRLTIPRTLAEIEGSIAQCSALRRRAAPLSAWLQHQEADYAAAPKLADRRRHVAHAGPLQRPRE